MTATFEEVEAEISKQAEEVPVPEAEPSVPAEAHAELPHPVVIAAAAVAAPRVAGKILRRRRRRKQNHPLRRLAALGAAGLAVYVQVIGPWQRRWGATGDEVAEPLPGDDRVENPNYNTTRAVDIDAPPEKVWPWLVQMGQGRGGLYSYDFMENLVGLNFKSLGHIDPALQDLKVGDVIPLEPSGRGYEVMEIEPDRYMLLYAPGAHGSPVPMEIGEGFKTTWLFMLRPLDDGQRTRLIVRWRAFWDITKSVPALLIGLGLDPAEFIMERKMLLGIKERAER